jgi:threonine dehydrogenase-like Zn-dependent dehydrogenase
VSRAAVLIGANRIVVEDRALPRPGPDEVRLRVTAAGVCGTDIAIFSGDYRVPVPRVLGHEFVGIVESVGSPQDAGLVGRRATAEINNTCIARRLDHLCPACRRKMPNHCLARTTIGINGADGAFAEHIVVPAGNVHIVPDEIDDTLAVFVEPFAAAIQTFEMSPIQGGDTVVILGVGRLGALICAVASAWLEGEAPAEPPRWDPGSAQEDLRPPAELPIIIAVDTDHARRDRALRVGAALSLTPDEVLADEIRERTNGLGSDVVVEATGTPDGLRLALELVRPRGTIALKSTCGLPSEIDQTKVVVDEIRIQGSRCGPFEKAIRHIKEGKLDLSVFDIYNFPLNETCAAIEAAMTCDKAVIRP